MKVLITDYAWKSLEPEKEILAGVGASLVVASTGAEDELARLAGDVEGILTCWKPVTEGVIRNATRCKAIGRYGIGLDNINVACATELGIVVTNVPSYCVEEVSDHALALILSLARKVAQFDHAIKDGRYDLGSGMPIHRLRGSTVGIVGFGKIGRALARKALGLGFRVIVYSRQLSPPYLEGYEVEPVSFPELLRHSDFISLHIPLTRETRLMFNISAFERMKPTAFLINTSRGALIDEVALLSALDQGLIAGAGLDVLSCEPPSTENPLIHHRKIIVTPHAAFYSEESVLALQTTAASQMAEVLSAKRPKFIVNPEVLQRANLRVRFESPVNS